MAELSQQEEEAVRQLRSRYNRISVSPSDAIPNPLYHYTSAGGLVGIVSEGVLRAGNFSFLNDYTEIQYGWDLTEQVIEQRTATERRGKEIAAPWLLRRVEQAMGNLGDGLEFYLSCFCAEPDLLSQWRAYGSAKGRFCIGFDTEAIPLSLSRVLYDKEAQTEKVGRRLDEAIESLGADPSSFLVTVRG